MRECFQLKSYSHFWKTIVYAQAFLPHSLSVTGNVLCSFLWYLAAHHNTCVVHESRVMDFMHTDIVSLHTCILHALRTQAGVELTSTAQRQEPKVIAGPEQA